MFKVKETGEAEELDEDDEDEAVPVETESYVNLRKKMVTKHNLKIDNLLKENGKLCREFKKKQVKKKEDGSLPFILFHILSDTMLVF